MNTISKANIHKKDSSKLVLYFAITFIFSWLAWGVGAGKNAVLHVIGTFGTTITALILTLCYEGFPGLQSILSRLLKWQVGFSWYLFVFGSTTIIPIFATLIHIWQGGTIIQTNDPRQWYLIFPVFFQILFFSVLGEEIGWRGYALPRMRTLFGSFHASILLGLIWGVWHLPLFWIEGNFHQQIPFNLFMLQSIALSILLTWLYNRTSESLFIVHLFHAASNTFLGVFPIMPENTSGDLNPLWTAAGLLWVLVIGIILLGKQDWFGSGNPKKQETGCENELTQPWSRDQYTIFLLDQQQVMPIAGCEW